MTSTYTRQLPNLPAVDLAVCGGGPTGLSAALSAARSGLRVLLIEQQGQCGGVGTSAGVCHLLGGRTNDNRTWCVSGIFRELVEELARRGDAIDPRTISIPSHQTVSPHGWTGRISAISYGVPVDPYGLAAWADEQLQQAGVHVLFQTAVVDVLTSARRITDLVLYNKSGLCQQPVRAVIDATGDADIAFRSGCQTTSGRPGDGLMTPATLIFHVERIDTEAVSAYIEATGENRFLALIRRLRAEGRWPFPYDRLIMVKLPQEGVYMINTSRLTGIDGTDGRSLSQGLMRGRQETRQLLQLLRDHVPGCAQARIRFVAPALGVRETRRIVGDWIYRVDDLLEERTYEDCIGFSGYGWDLPDPLRPSYQPMEHDLRAKRRRDYTPIPYRVLLPRPIENLAVGGRCISVERDVLGPLREQAPCMAMGQAAGLAARQVVQQECTFAAVDVGLLRRELTAAGAVVDWQEPADCAVTAGTQTTVV